MTDVPIGRMAMATAALFRRHDDGEREGGWIIIYETRSVGTNAYLSTEMAMSVNTEAHILKIATNWHILQ